MILSTFFFDERMYSREINDIFPCLVKKQLITLALSQTPLEQDLSNFALYDLAWGRHFHSGFDDLDLVSSHRCVRNLKLQISCFGFLSSVVYLLSVRTTWCYF